MKSTVINKELIGNYSLVFLIAWLPLQAIFALAKLTHDSDKTAQAALYIENRVILDIDSLHLAEPDYNILGQPEKTNQYVERLNNFLERKRWPLRVTEILTKGTADNTKDSEFVTQFSDANKTVEIGYRMASRPWSFYFSFYPLWAALLIVFLVREKVLSGHLESKVQKLTSDEKAWMKIDLPNKRLVNAVTGQSVILSNKPLCFYCALLEYSIEHSEPVLNPNKELPEEVLELATKYFFRLIELGHTIRKRPNFNNNLEKVLSEIRAALDELFADDIKRKTNFYPPKAIGEGSRSKLHNVALLNISEKDVEFLGK